MRIRGRVPIIAVFVIFVVIGAVVKSSRPHRGEILVSAASSLTDVMNEIGKAYSSAHPGTRVRFNLGSSGALQQQIEQGAPADVFCPASLKEMDALEKEQKVEAQGHVLFAGNRLALIVPAGGRVQHWLDLGQPRVHRVAISNPDSVPSGRYAKETLLHRGLWAAVHGKAVFGENVRQTLTYVVNGDVDAGIVFSTDAKTDPKRVRVVELAVPGIDHKPIFYPAAVVQGAPHAAEAREFVAFLRSPVARSIFVRYGFLPVE